MRAIPSDEVELISSRPLMLLTASSILLVISVSTSSGDAPGLMTVTVTIGASILGIRSTPSEKYVNIPETTSARINIVAKTGRLIQSFANPCMIKDLIND